MSFGYGRRDGLGERADRCIHVLAKKIQEYIDKDDDYYLYKYDDTSRRTREHLEYLETLSPANIDLYDYHNEKGSYHKHLVYLRQVLVERVLTKET
jgi:hypothetical protein